MVPIFPYAKIKSEKNIPLHLSQEAEINPRFKKKKGMGILEFYKQEPLNAKKTVK